MKMRRFLVMISLLLAVFAVSVRAEDIPTVPLENDNAGITEDTTSIPAEDTSSDAVQVPAETPTEISVQGTNSDAVEVPWEPTPDVGKDNETENGAFDSKTWTDIVIDTIYAYRNDIISASGAVAFLIYSFLYKKKLVPSVDGLRDKVVSTMAGVVGDVQGYIETFTGKLNTQQETWNKKINEIADVVKGFESVMNKTQQQQTEVLALEQQLSASDTRNEIYGRIMRAQVEMIHQTLSSACLSDEQHAANHKAYLKQIEMLDALDEELAAKTGAVSEVIAADEEQAGEAVMADETVSG
ncbi:MAG: hypothetical protein IIX15_05290 [Clostridia bacterium]|nr:hypothetical protein [Clostridia bacterium]